MSDVIRDAIIRLRLEQQKTTLQAPDVTAAKRAYEEQAKASKEAVKSTQDAGRATKELERVSTESSYKMLVNFREGGEGALRMARGIAFLSASGSDDLRKLVQTVAIAQGAFDIFAGGFKLFSNIGVLFGPVGIAITGITTAIGGGIMAWRSWRSAAEEASAAAIKAAQEFKKLTDERMTARNQERSDAMRRVLESVGANVDASILPTTRLARTREAMARLRSEEEAVASREANLRRLLGTVPGMSDPRNLAREDPAQARQLMGYAERRREVLQVERDLARDRFELEKDLAERQANIMASMLTGAAQGANAIGLPGVGAFGVSQAGGNFANQFDAAMNDFINKAQAAFDRFVRMMNEQADRADTFQKALREIEAGTAAR